MLPRTISHTQKQKFDKFIKYTIFLLLFFHPKLIHNFLLPKPLQYAVSQANERAALVRSPGSMFPLEHILALEKCIFLKNFF